jgi:hypothetical protein
MSKVLNIILSKFKYILSLYFIFQLILLFKFPIQYSSDSGYYFKLAQDCLAQHGLYPLPQHLYEDYIVAPLYVNTITFLLMFFNSSIIIGIFNIVLNSLQIILLYKITDSIINERAAKISVILYILYLNNIGLILLNLTELFFTVTVSAGIYFYLKQKTWAWILTGIFCGLSIAIRPLGWALVLSLSAILIYKIYKKDIGISAIVNLFAGLVGIILIFGYTSKVNFGEFVYTSNNGPLNMLMGANENANGGYYEKVFEKGASGYIEHPERLAYYQKEQYWQTKAYSWISAHPVKWIMLLPKKLFLIYAWDDIAISPLVFDNYNLLDFLKGIKEHIPMGTSFHQYSTLKIIIWGLLQIYQHLFYFFILFLFIFGIIKYRKNIFKNTNYNLLLLFSFVGIMLTLAAVGAPRYKYPYMFIIFIFNSLFISMYLSEKES